MWLCVLFLSFIVVCVLFVFFQAEEMISRIKAAFIDNLPNLMWMDEDTRKAAVEKVSS
jgi:Peptidase family M13